MSSDSLVRYRISPIQMNSGRAVMVQLEDEAQIVVIMVSPTGREVNSSIPTQATPIRASPTQTPVPSRKKRTARKMMMARSSVMSSLPEALIDDVAAQPALPLEEDRNQVVEDPACL